MNDEFQEIDGQGLKKEGANELAQEPSAEGATAQPAKEPRPAAPQNDNQAPISSESPVSGTPQNSQSYIPPEPYREEPATPYIPNNNQYPPQPPQQPNQWTFNDYGPIGAHDGRRQEKPPKVKKDKPEKSPKSPGNGYKVLAVLMCILFVLSVAGFGSYVIYDLGREGENKNTPPYIQNSDGKNADTAVSPDDILTGDKLTNQEIYKLVEPAVVGIVGYLRGSTGTQVASQGSGIVFEENGLIVTNNHVVKIENTNRPYDKIEVIYSNGDKYDATLLGGDKETDLAVLKIDAEGLKKAVFGDSDQVQVGDKALVIGNPSGIAFAGSLTQGTVSAVHREVRTDSLSNKKTEYIQTDAAINPGNSGGALVNEYGQIIGITSAKIAKENYEGMGFAIPINNAKPIIDSLSQNGYVKGRVKIGISYTAISDTLAELNGLPKGLRVVSIEENSDALRQGLQKGDIITKIDGKEVYDTETVSSTLEGKKPGDAIVLTVYRVDESEVAKYINLNIKLIEKTEE